MRINKFAENTIVHDYRALDITETRYYVKVEDLWQSLSTPIIWTQMKYSLQVLLKWKHLAECLIEINWKDCGWFKERFSQKVCSTVRVLQSV